MRPVRRMNKTGHATSRLEHGGRGACPPPAARANDCDTARRAQEAEGDPHGQGEPGLPLGACQRKPQFTACFHRLRHPALERTPRLPPGQVLGRPVISEGPPAAPMPLLAHHPRIAMVACVGLVRPGGHIDGAGQFAAGIRFRGRPPPLSGPPPAQNARAPLHEHVRDPSPLGGGSLEGGCPRAGGSRRTRGRGGRGATCARRTAVGTEAALTPRC